MVLFSEELAYVTPQMKEMAPLTSLLITKYVIDDSATLSFIRLEAMFF
jgi:hypothetical protein